MATVKVHLGCDCEDGVHYVDVEYEYNQPDRHFIGEWAGSDDCVCEMTDERQREIEGRAEEMVATGEVY